jgi:V8-like Glu-specific endopeptidase
VERVTAEELFYRCPLEMGAAGAPIFNENGALVGMHFGSITSNSDALKVGIPIDVFRELIP